MLRLQPPSTEAGYFHNFRCGEVYCIGPSTYHVCCSLCGQNILYELFPQHFLLEHLSQEEECKLFSKDGKLIKHGEEVDVVVKAEDDPIGYHGDDSETVDLAQIAMLDFEDEGTVASVESEVPISDEDKLTVVKSKVTHEDRNIKVPATAQQKKGSKTEQIETVQEPLLRSSRRRRPVESAAINVTPTAVPKKIAIETPANKPIKALTPQPFTENDNGSESPGWQPDSDKQFDKIDDVNEADNDEDDDDSSDVDRDMCFPCSQCDRFYHSQRGLQYHIRSKHSTGKSLESKTTKKNVTKVQEFKCSDCDMVFRNDRELRGHRWKHTGITCDICGKPFTQTGNLTRHRVRHTGIKAFKCGECDASFYTNKELNSHKICHTGRMPVICEICGRPCRDRGVLTAHMRRHTGERPAKCDVCGKSFYSFHDLNVHAVAHTSARPFVCDICGSTFQRKKALRVHKLLHSDKRKYACKICGKAFAQSGGLNAHLRIHDAAAVRATTTDAKDAVKTLVAVDDTGECSIENVAVAGIEHAHLHDNDDQMNVAVNVATGEVTISMTVDAIDTIPWVPQ